jgi:hypothetical protein
LRDADRFAQRLWTAAGVALGALAGLLSAPRVQWDLHWAGVDPVRVGPAIVIVGACATLVGVISWRIGRVVRPVRNG